MSAAEGLALLSALGTGARQPLNVGQQVLQPQVGPSPGSYRHRTATQWRGVTATTGTNTGIQKYDVQFVFCDNGTKKHPKIYGFPSLDAAARAFDILTCKRALEKGRTMASVMAEDTALGTNHPAANYRNQALLRFLEAATRDDCIYGLKQCAKKGHSLAPSVMLEELQSGVEAARAEAAEKRRVGDPRQSYEATAKGSERRRRAASSGNTGGCTPAVAASTTMGERPFGVPQLALDCAATLSAEDIVGQPVCSTPMTAPCSVVAAAATASAGTAAGVVAAASQDPSAAACPLAMDVDVEPTPNGSLPSSEEERGQTPAGMAAAAPPPVPDAAADIGPSAPAGAAGGPAVAAVLKPEQPAAKQAVADEPASGATPTDEQPGNAPLPPPAAGDTKEAAWGTTAATTAATATAAAAAIGATMAFVQAKGQAPAVAAPAAPPSQNEAAIAAATMAAVQQQQQQCLLAQLLQAAGCSPSTAPPPPVSAAAPPTGRLASQGLPLLLELLRLGASSSQEVSCAHDIIRIWTAVHQGQNWQSEQSHLPHQYYKGLLPVLQACPDVSSILALTSQLWQSGMLCMLSSAYSSSLQQQQQQQQASALALFHSTAPSSGASRSSNIAQGGATAALQAAISQLLSPGAAVSGVSGATGDASTTTDGIMSAIGAVIQNPSIAQLLSQLAISGATGSDGSNGSNNQSLAALLAGIAGGVPPPVHAAPVAPTPPLPTTVTLFEATQHQQHQQAVPPLPARLTRQPSNKQRQYSTRQASGELPASKRPRRHGGRCFGSAPGSKEPPPPPQLQQLLEILSGENPSLQELPSRQTPAPQPPQQQLQMGITKPELEVAATQPAATGSNDLPVTVLVAERQPSASVPAMASAFRAAAQQLPAAPAGGAAAQVIPTQRARSPQRSLSSQLPLPANQPKVLIVPAATAARQKSCELGPPFAADGVLAPASRLTAPPPPSLALLGGHLELTVTAAPAERSSFGGGGCPNTRGGATITTGLNRGAAGGALQITTGTGSAPAAAPLATAMVSAFAAAAAMPAIPAAPQLLAPTPLHGKCGTLRQAPARAASSPATITTGISAPTGRPSVSWPVGGAAVQMGLEVLSQAASLQQPSSQDGKAVPALLMRATAEQPAAEAKAAE